MFDSLLRQITNIIFAVPLKVKRLKSREPGARVLVASATKARRLKKDEDVQRGSGWIAARRGTLILTDQRLECGPWKIPLSVVNDAMLVRVKSMFSSGLILKLATEDGFHYQFGMQYDPAWEKQSVLKLRMEDGKITYSAFSVVVRLVLVGWIAWLIVSWVM